MTATPAIIGGETYKVHSDLPDVQVEGDGENVAGHSEILITDSLERKTKNIGEFSELQEYMSKKHIRETANDFNLDMKGITLNIDKNSELLRVPFTGRADYETIGQITFFPNAFKNKEELIRTIFHEKCHVEQYRKYGTEFVLNNRKRFEEEAYELEESFIQELKKKGML